MYLDAPDGAEGATILVQYKVTILTFNYPLFIHLFDFQMWAG